MMITTKPASPARPKTNPARGLLLRKDFLGSEVPLEGGLVAEDVSVIVIGSFGLAVGVDVGRSEDTDDILFES